jgi:small multidrug resistance pump
MKWLFLFIAILAEVIGTSALKYSEGFTRWLPSAIVVIGYGIAFYFLSLTLKSIPIGIAYAIWSGLGIVLITAIGFFVFKQTPDIPAIIGIGLIIIGVIVINLFSKTVAD